MALFKIYNNIDNPRMNEQTGEPILPETYNKGYMYFDANTNIFYIDTAGTGGNTGTRVKLNAWGAHNAYQALRSEGIPYGVVDNTSTSTAFTATVQGITELKDGTIMLLKNGKVTSASGFTININGLGAKPVYNNMAAASQDSTIFNVNYTMLFIYDSTRVSGGCWICYRGYNSDNNTIGYQLRTNSIVLPTITRTRYYRLLFTSADNTHWVPANTTYDNSATSTKTPNSNAINPFGRIVYMSGTTNYPAESNVGATVCWDQYTLTLGYSFNYTLTAGQPVYVKCTPQNDGSAVIDSTTPIVQNLPSTKDNKIYIFLGDAYDSTHLELVVNHPIYYHDGDGIKLWSGIKVPTKVSDLTNDSGYITSYTNTTYTFANGVNGSFTVTPSGGSAQTVTVGKVGTAGVADSVGHSLTIGTYTFNGSEDVTIPVYDGTYTWG